VGDWFRQTSWSTEIEEHFFKKLAHARKESRAQYLKIQAIELIETRRSTALDAAEMLVQKLLNDYPDNKIDRSQSFQSLGDIYKLRGDFVLSLDYYKRALDHEQIYPNVKTQAYLDFSEIVIKLEKQEVYSFIQLIILDRVKNSPFPLEKYRSYSFLSIINFRKGNYDEAIEFSALAEESASAKTISLRYHRDLGVVIKREKWLDELITYYKTK
jgi:tetratricopeptide (TPR) repeat protein